MPTQEQLLRQIRERFPELESATLESTMNEQTVFLEQLKLEQKRQLEAQKAALNELIAEKRRTLRQVDGKLRRGTNRTPKKKKSRK